MQKCIHLQGNGDTKSEHECMEKVKNKKSLLPLSSNHPLWVNLNHQCFIKYLILYFDIFDNKFDNLISSSKKIFLRHISTLQIITKANSLTLTYLKNSLTVSHVGGRKMYPLQSIVSLSDMHDMT